MMAAADAFLANNNSLNWAGLSAAQQATVNGWMTKLDSYNNGNEGTDALRLTAAATWDVRRTAEMPSAAVVWLPTQTNRSA